MATKNSFNNRCKPWTWCRFQACIDKLKSKYGVKWAEKICASIWRKAYWNNVFNKMSQKWKNKKS